MTRAMRLYARVLAVGLLALGAVALRNPDFGASDPRTVAEVLEISVAEYLLGLHRQAVVHVRRPRSSE